MSKLYSNIIKINYRIRDVYIVTVPQEVHLTLPNFNIKLFLILIILYILKTEVKEVWKQKFGKKYFRKKFKKGEILAMRMIDE